MDARPPGRRWKTEGGMDWLRSLGEYLVRVAKQWIWVVGFVTAVIGLWALQENATVVLPTTVWIVMTVALLFIAQYLAFAEYRREAERMKITSPAGRQRMADTLVHFHGRGVAELQNGPNAAWNTEKEMADWIAQDSFWTGELIATVREAGDELRARRCGRRPALLEHGGIVAWAAWAGRDTAP